MKMKFIWGESISPKDSIHRLKIALGAYSDQYARSSYAFMRMYNSTLILML